MNLTALQNSPFLQSLGWAIANSLWQAAALWIAYLLVNGIYKGASARFKNNLSTILLSSAFVWFCITLFSKYFAIQNLSADYEVQIYQADNITTTTTWNSLLNKIASVLPYLSVAYLFLLIFLSARLINIYRFTRFIKFNGLQKPGVEWKLFTEKVARHMGITKKIRIWVSHHIDVPATIGFIKPVILIPLASINQLSSDQLEAIILHELSHIKRNDYLINLFISIIETILFFNPFVVLLAKIIKRERENCCDDFVIQYQYDRHAYASALLSLEQFRNINLRLAIGATSGKKQLLHRIKRIMEVNSNSNFNYGQKLVALFLITGIICSVAWLSPENKQRKKQEAKVSKNVLPEKINRDQIPEVLFTSRNDNKVKDVVVNSQPKKVTPKTENALKELKALNLQQIALREYGLADRLLQESKKQIAHKSLQKINLNKFLMARGGNALFDNAKVMLPANAFTYFEAPGQQFYSVDMQKLQAEFDKAQFTFSFDQEQMENAAKDMLKAENLQSLRRPQQNMKEVLNDFQKEKKLNTELKNAIEKKVKRIQVDNIRISTVYNDRSFYFVVDTLMATEEGLLREHNRQATAFTKITPGENKTVTTTPVYGYSYGYGNTVTVDGKEIKRVSRNSSAGSTQKQAPVRELMPGVIYHRIPTGENDPAKTTTPKPQTHNKVNLRLEYKNGIIVINGKKIDLPDTHEMFALSTVKGKKLLSKAKDLVDSHIDY